MFSRGSSWLGDWTVLHWQVDSLPLQHQGSPIALLQSYIIGYSSVQSLSRVWLFATPWIAARQASLSVTNSRSSLRLTSIESVMPSSHLILCRLLLLLPPIPPFFQWVNSSHEVKAGTKQQWATWECCQTDWQQVLANASRPHAEARLHL